MEPSAPSLIRQIRLDSSDSSCSNHTRSIASLGGSEDSILEERTAGYCSGRQGSSPRQLSDGFSPDEQDSGFNSNPQLESSPNNDNLRCRPSEIRYPRGVRGGSEDSDDVWLPRFPRPRKLGVDRTLGTSGSLGSTDSWIENSVSEEDEEMDDGDIARCLTSMSMGSGVIKVKGSGHCGVKTLYLDGNKSCVRWRPSKKGTKARISIDSIKEIRQGPNTDNFKRYQATGNRCQTKTCFSIIHSSSWETFDLVLDTEEETAIWIRGLKHLLKGVKSEVRRHNSNKLKDSWLKATFEAADKSGDGLLSMDEVLKLLHKLNVNLSKRKVKQLFKEADSQDENIGKLDFDEFIHFYRTISTRQEVDLLLKDYGCGKGYLTLQEFARYLREEQRMGDVELELCQELVQTYEPIPENVKNGWIGIDGFTRFLLSHEGNIFNPAHREVNQDMTRPLTHYYIASSHNTYLVGDQLMSQSSVDVYALVLQAGCRCVEMDCWDGKEGEPIIYHGYTLTSKIKFRDVISIISKYAFVTSPYPVILSIENHCSLEQQKKMAQYLVEILGEMLHVPTFDKSRTTLLSPEELKGKILIKAKKLSEDHNENLEAGEVSEEDSADELDDDLKLERSSISKKFESVAMAQLMLMRKKPITPTRSAWQRIISKVREDSKQKDFNSKNHERSSSLTGTLRRLKLSKKKVKSQSSSESSEGGSLDLLEKSATDDESAGEQSSTGNPKLPSPLHIGRSHKGKSMVLCRQLSELVKLTRSVGFRGFQSTMASWELPSLGEIRASNFVATKAPDFTQFTTSHLCRVYPSAYRIDSSNYNPQPMWNCGCQLVALNYQTEGRPTQLSRAKFSLNGNCGYALKHPLLCDENKSFDPNSGDPVPHLPKKQLTLHIISGQQLPKPPQSLLGERGEIIDPYVEVEVIGLPVDCAKSQTKTIQDNGFNPFWDCTMTFTIHLPEMALIRFAVWDEDPIGRDFIGQATFPVISLMPGYRHIHLEGLDQATLFVHVTMEDYNSWVNNTARVKPRGSQCRTKSVELEYSPLSSPTHHRQSPRRKSSLGLVQKLNMRRRHSMAALPPRELSPLPAPGTRMKRRSYEEGHMMTGSAGELRPVGEEFSEQYFELALPCTDTALDKILHSPIQTRLEADGTFSISVDDFPAVLDLNIPFSTIFEAVREQKVSLWSDESYTSVERSFMAELLTEEELERNSEGRETESIASTLSYEQFIQDVFEDCFSPELSYDPCPDLLKEASSSCGTESGTTDITTSNTKETSNTKLPCETSSLPDSTDCAADSSGLETPTNKRDSSDEDNDDVFLPHSSKQDDASPQQAIKEPDCQKQKFSRLDKPSPLSIFNPPRSPSSSLSSPLLSPNSPQLGTFTRGTVERLSRIIYDDTAEFLQPSVDSQITSKSSGEASLCLDQRCPDSLSITTPPIRESGRKYQKESQGSFPYNEDDDSVASCKTASVSTNENDTNPVFDTTVCNTDHISASQSNISHFHATDEKNSICNSKEICDDCRGKNMSPSHDVVTSNVGITNGINESDTSADLHRHTSPDEKATGLLFSEEELKSDNECPAKESPSSLNRLQNNRNPSNTEHDQLLNRSQTSQADHMKPEQINSYQNLAQTIARPATSDRNNNEKFLSKLLELRKQQQIQRATLETSLQHREKFSSTFKTDFVKQPQLLVDDDGRDSDDGHDSSDGDVEDSSSSTSSSSIASSTSSSDTVVEVPSFTSTPNGMLLPSSKDSTSLSPLKLEDIFDPSECQQFRSELVQRWQKSIPEDEPVCRPSSPETNHQSSVVLRETQGSPTGISESADGPKQYSQPISHGLPHRLKVSSQMSCDINEKRLSWPPRSTKKNTFTERIPNWGQECQACPENRSGSRSLKSRGNDPNLASIVDQRFMLKPASRHMNLDEMQTFAETSEQLSGDCLHHPSHQEVVYRRHLSKVRLTKPPNCHMSDLSSTESHSKHSSALGFLGYPYHSGAYKKSNSLPASSMRTPLAERFPKTPPSYEDHISRYGPPPKFKSTQANNGDKHAPACKLWRAEPVTISQVRTIRLHSAQDIFKMKRDQVHISQTGSLSESKSETLSEASETESENSIADEQLLQKQCIGTRSCLSRLAPGTIQCHPTPPRRRKKLQRSFSDEGMALLGDNLMKGGKKWTLDSPKNHNIYLMLTL